MNKKILFEIKALYRDNLRIVGYEFGSGENSVCIIGSMRGNEVQQIYTCSKLVSKLKIIDKEGKIKNNKKFLLFLVQILIRSILRKGFDQPIIPISTECFPVMIWEKPLKELHREYFKVLRITILEYSLRVFICPVFLYLT